MAEPTRPSDAMPDEFDRLMGQLDGLTGVSKSRPFTVTAVPLFGVGGSSRYIVETWRHRNEPADQNEPATSRDVVFLVIASPVGYFRHVLPAEVVDAIVRQRDALATKLRKRLGKQHAPRLRQMAAERKARGEKPAFLKKRRAKK